MASGIHTFQFVAGHVALDFVNTVAFRADPARRADRLERAEDVQRWADQARLPDLAAMRSAERQGTAGLRRIRETREQLFAVFHAIATGDSPSADTVARIGNALHDCDAQHRLCVDGANVRWSWRASARYADRLLYPILTAAVDLLTSDSRESVRQCEDADCGWLFLDRSNARRRRWCSMAECGNRNKVRNFYRREAGLA